MKLNFTLLFFVSVFTFSFAQAQRTGDTTASAADSAIITDLKETTIENIPEVSIDETDISGTNEQSSVSPILLTSRDPFFSAATFNFSAGRFRFRGYNSNFSTTYMNGLTMETLENGLTPYGQWSGLNYVLRNRQISIGLAPTTFGYGNIGTAVNIDTRASKQRKTTQIGYTYSNGSVAHRFSIMHSTGLSKKGWAFTIAGTFRGADEGYVQGTYTNNFSYFGGIDKKFGEKHLISLVGFAAHTESGIASGSVQEMQQLANDKYYNPNWGYQNGKKRNAVINKSNQPVFILTHEYNIAKNSSLTTALGYTFGDRSRSGLDWYNAADPRPDYYRNLPSYVEDDLGKENVAEAIRSDINLRQLNWEGFYTANRNNFQTINNVDGIAGNKYSGFRSSYIQASRVTNTKRASIRTVFNQKLNKYTDFSFGISHQAEKNNYYQKVDDLLGGQYYVDLNQFAERDFPDNPDAGQTDLNHPNRILKAGDKYSYNYDININKTATWTQGVFKYKKLDLFASGELSNTQFYREGYTKNGLFPDNSFGKSKEYSFNNYSLKAGIGFRFNIHNYIYINATQLTRAPYYRDVYLSPRTRDFVQDNLNSTSIKSVEAGYVVVTPFVKVRLSGYYTEIKDALQIISFYHDVYRSFVNNAYSKQGAVNFGGELGLESRVIKNVIISGAAAIGRFYYNGRPEVTVTSDNASNVLGQSTIYTNNYRNSFTPQEAYSLGLQYRSPRYWNIGANVNYFDQIWQSINPVRRTTDIVSGIERDSKLWHEVLDQTRLPGQTTVDAFAGYSWKLPSNFLKRKAFLFINVNVKNLLDNKDFITGSSEQLRYDNVDNNVDKFPPRLFYAYGRTYSVSATLRF